MAKVKEIFEWQIGNHVWGICKGKSGAKEYVKMDNMASMTGEEWMRITKFIRGDWWLVGVK